jgi:thiamine biosynthesis lipoprotein
VKKTFHLIMCRACCVILFSVCTLSLFVSCSPARGIEAVEYLMGTRILIRLAPCEGRNAREDIQAIIQEIRKFEYVVSAHREDSFCARLALHGEANFETEDEKEYLYPLLVEAFTLARASGGSFDPLIGRLTALWGFSSLALPAAPPLEEARTQALAASGQGRLLRLNESGMAVERGAALDLGAIAKGEILDRVAEELSSWGYRQALLNFGGDVRVLGPRISAKDEPWRVALQHPRKAQGYWEIVHIRGGAVATSGDYERYFLYQGERYHHILDPESGLPARRAVAASVLGPRAALTDALSTALFVLGAEDGLKLLTHFPDYHGMVVFLSNDTLIDQRSPGFAEFAAGAP